MFPHNSSRSHCFDLQFHKLCLVAKDETVMVDVQEHFPLPTFEVNIASLVESSNSISL